jgi:hypothetical protein
MDRYARFLLFYEAYGYQRPCLTSSVFKDCKISEGWILHHRAWNGLTPTCKEDEFEDTVLGILQTGTTPMATVEKHGVSRWKEISPFCFYCSGEFPTNMDTHVKDCIVRAKFAFIADEGKMFGAIEAKINNSRVKCSVCDIENCVSSTFKRWMGKEMCGECYDQCPTIQSTLASSWLRLRQLCFFFERGNKEQKESTKTVYSYTRCNLCDRQVSHPTDYTLPDLVRSQWDHIDLLDKGGSVGHMIMEGEPWELVAGEIKKCRRLCLRCHSCVTASEQCLGLGSLKSAITRMGKKELPNENLIKRHTEAINFIRDKVEQKCVQFILDNISRVEDLK